MSGSNEAFHGALDIFAPGLSWIFRILSQALGIDVQPYVLPLITLSAISTFLLPSILKFIAPITSTFVSSAEVQYHDKLYPQLIRWMSGVEFSSLRGSVIVGITQSLGFLWDLEDVAETVDTNEPAYRGKLRRVRITPGHNHLHFFQYDQCWFALCRYPYENHPYLRNGEDITIYYFRKNHKKLDDLFQTIQKVYIDSSQGKIPVFRAHQSKKETAWRQTCPEPCRSLDSLAMNPMMSQEIVEDVRKFLSEDTKKSYRDRGIPWRRGLLFHGPPGTGKTSFCRILASMFAIPIYIINLANIDDDAFQELFCTMPDGCIVLLEDIDAAGIKNRELGNEAPEQKVSLATVLNAFDGIGTHTGHLLIVTTNKKLSLDPALTRPGRIDRQYEFGYLNASTIKSFFIFFFHASSPNETIAEEIRVLASEFSNMAPREGTSPAALQEYFLQCNNDPQAAIANAASLWKCRESIVKPVSILPISTIDVEISQLQKSDGTGHFTGAAIVYGYHPDDLSTPYVLVCQRAPDRINDTEGAKSNSSPNTWGLPAGKYSSQDSTLLKTIVRETYEETKLKLWSASDHIYRVSFEHKGRDMAKYFIIARTREKVNCQRIWSDEHHEPRGSDENPICLSPVEHCDYCWVTMKQVQSSTVYHLGDAARGRLAILDSDKRVLVEFFTRLKDGCDMEYRLPDLELPEDHCLRQD